MRQERLPIKEKIKQHLWQREDGRKLRIGVGCANIGKGEGGKINNLQEELDVLLTAYEHGFRFFDTSSDYQAGRSEVVLGEFLKLIPRQEIFLSTKSNFAWQTNKKPFAAFRESFYQSFSRLNVDYIDLYQIHDTEHFGCCEQEVIPFLQEQQRKGLIGYLGTGMRSLNAHELAVRSGSVQAVLSYQNYSLLSRAGKQLALLCQERNCAFINASVLHFGLLKSPDPMNYSSGEAFDPSYFRRWQEDTVKLQALCKSAGLSILAPALQYSLLNPAIDITLNGIHRLENITSTVSAITERIHPETWAEIQRIQDKNEFMDIQDDLLW